MDFACEGFVVGVNHEGVDLFFGFECADHRERAIGCREGKFDQLECVIDCHCGEARGGVGGCVHVSDDCVGEVGECVGECADCHVRGGVGGGVEMGEVRWGWSVV